MRNAKIETLCFNARAQLYILQISHFSHFLIYARPILKSKNLRQFQKILLIFLHSFMVNQNEKWWHISNFSSFVDVESLLFFCLIEISTIWREVETGIPKVAFSTIQKTITAGNSITNEKKTKRMGFFFGTEISCVFLNPEKEKRKLS